MFAEFRARYPTGALVSHMLEFAQGQYVVSVSVKQEGEVLATGMAAAGTLEEAEDRARIRALEAFGLVEIDYDGTVHLLGDGTLGDRTDMAQLSGTDPAQPLLAAGVAMATAPQESPSISKVTTAPPDPSSHTPSPASPPKTQTTPASIPPPDYPLLEFESVTSPDPETASPVSPPSPSPVPLRSPQSAPSPSQPTTSAPDPTAPVDLSDAIAQIDLLMRQLGWTKKEGVTHLKTAYGKRTRAELTDQELMEFLGYLQDLAHGEPDF